ncbi:O-antigen ligase family protein [Paracraurococcus lichenis]|uniref:O-antigen ligase n=1 Tax=Paracraurococcus lichenis TaxID=3064888 RepID=A0ABT9E8P1_9PROT|nr:O-antigen ligase [Paracraurococcus sp. LOR1-02]MDO9712567.1 O-antigen ligase [Paracraurococcus sp. LOR1-02]
MMLRPRMRQRVPDAAPRPGRPPRWHGVAIVVFILLVTGALGLIDRLVYGSWEGKTGSKITQALNILLIAIALRLFATGWVRERRLLPGEGMALGLTGFLILSALWSIDPATSLRRGVLYLFFVIGAIGIARVCEADRFMRLVRLACLICAAGSLALLAAYPSAAVMMGSAAQEVQGVFTHKNVLGQAMAVGALACLHGMRTTRRPGAWPYVALLLIMAVALLSKSATACLTIFAFCAISLGVVLYRRGGIARMAATGAAVIGAPVGLVIIIDPSGVLELIGKDPTLTGRTELWAAVFDNIAQRPFLGWGLGAFWLASNPAGEAISDSLGWVVPHAHNGILEMLLEVGVFGTAFFLLIWTRTVAMAVRLIGSPARDLAVTALMACGGFVLIGATEIVLLDHTQALITVFYVTGFMCERTLRLRARSLRASRRAAGPVGYSQRQPWVGG